MGTLGQVLAALLPSAGVGLLFWWAIRAIMRSDRAEREAMDALEAQSGTPAPDQETPA